MCFAPELLMSFLTIVKKLINNSGAKHNNIYIQNTVYINHAIFHTFQKVCYLRHIYCACDGFSQTEATMQSKYRQSGCLIQHTPTGKTMKEN